MSPYPQTSIEYPGSVPCGPPPEELRSVTGSGTGSPGRSKGRYVGRHSGNRHVSLASLWAAASEVRGPSEESRPHPSARRTSISAPTDRPTVTEDVLIPGFSSLQPTLQNKPIAAWSTQM